MLSGLLSLTWPHSVERVPRADWSASDAAAVAQQEGRPVVAEGYLLQLRHEGVESPNCHAQGQRDYHVWLAVKPGTLADRAHSMVVELTPRVVARNPGWGGQAAILTLKGTHVRISGWLLLDQEHPEQLGATRGTLWEIHPVMRIAVEHGGKWTDLATGKPDTASTPPTPARTTATPTPHVLPPTASPASAAPTSTTAPAASTLTVSVSVSPDPIPYGAYPTVTIHTAPGANCTISVAYSTGRHPTSYPDHTATADSAGTISESGQWHMESKGGSGTITAKCSLSGQTADGSTSFGIA